MVSHSSPLPSSSPGLAADTCCGWVVEPSEVLVSEVLKEVRLELVLCGFFSLTATGSGLLDSTLGAGVDIAVGSFLF